MRKAWSPPHPDPRRLNCPYVLREGHVLSPAGAQLRSAEVRQGWLPDAVAPPKLEMISEGEGGG